MTDLTKTRLVGRLPGISLNDEGRRQAAAAAARMSALPVAAIFSSPLERSIETAAPLAEATGLPINQAAGLLEVDYGQWADQEYRVLRKTDLWKKVQRQPAGTRFPGGETIRDAQGRIVTAIEEIHGSHPQAVVAAYSHADMIRLAVAYFTGIHLDLYQRLAVSAGSVTALLLGAGTPALLRLNDVGTLADLKPPPPRRGKN
jgi:probable phosphomutase (TIGR03848 family)